MISCDFLRCLETNLSPFIRIITTEICCSKKQTMNKINLLVSFSSINSELFNTPNLKVHHWMNSSLLLLPIFLRFILKLSFHLCLDMVSKFTCFSVQCGFPVKILCIFLASHIHSTCLAYSSQVSHSTLCYILSLTPVPICYLCFLYHQI
jgi:hypothetical protein